VLFLEAKGGKIWRYREYWNPLVTVDASAVARHGPTASAHPIRRATRGVVTRVS
jgi:hypothetical protein